MVRLKYINPLVDRHSKKETMKHQKSFDGTENCVLLKFAEKL